MERSRSNIVCKGGRDTRLDGRKKVGTLPGKKEGNDTETVRRRRWILRELRKEVGQLRSVLQSRVGNRGTETGSDVTLEVLVQTKR